MIEPLIYEKSRPGRRAFSLPALEVPFNEDELGEFRRTHDVPLPEMPENEVMRHFVRLSRHNFHVDLGFYPLGSCTMKYNPKINEDVAALPGFARLHPMQEAEETQGVLAVMYHLQEALKAVSGFDAVSLQPAAGAHGELAGIFIIRKYHQQQGGLSERTKILIPDSAHGTNPASAALGGFKAVSIRSNDKGQIDIDDLRDKLGPDVAGMMITNPNTLGIFEENIQEIARLVHQAGGLMYMDGANMNALMGIAEPAAMGFDVMHFNLHKTFSTPHGGGGPGAGPVAVTKALAAFLPGGVVEKNGDRFVWHTPSHTIGRLHGFHGNVGMMIRALAYIWFHGGKGLAEVSKHAIINANYLYHHLRDVLDAPYRAPFVMHECVLSAQALKKETGVSTFDIAKRLIDYGFHPPTIYFPLIVPEALMIEPTETETHETLDAFIAAVKEIVEEAHSKPEVVHSAPHTTPTGRLDDAHAARHINVCCMIEY